MICKNKPTVSHFNLPVSCVEILTSGQRVHSVLDIRQAICIFNSPFIQGSVIHTKSWALVFLFHHYDGGSPAAVAWLSQASFQALLHFVCLFFSGHPAQWLFHRGPSGGQDIMLHDAGATKFNGARRKDTTVGL